MVFFFLQFFHHQYKIIIIIIIIIILGLHLWHMDIPWPGVELELQLPAYATRDLSHIWDLCHSLQQYWILNLLNEARDRILILMDTMLCS